jgi:ferredoxin
VRIWPELAVPSSPELTLRESRLTRLSGRIRRHDDDAVTVLADTYICGPQDCNAEIEHRLVAAGANADLVYVEDFKPAYDDYAVATRTENARVRFEPSGVEAEWIADESPTLLELGEEHGLPLPFDCRSGSCHTCEAELLEGEVDGAVTTLPGGRRRVLICSSYPRSPRIRIGE